MKFENKNKTDILFNPWRFANKREVADLSLFAHRFYNPHLMRWQTTDPLGFAESLNLYRYVRNNPFGYQDPDGHFALPFPAILTFLEVTFGTTASVTFLPALGATCACALVGYGCYQLCVYASNQIDTANEPETVKEDEENKEKFKFPKNPDDLMPELPRDGKGRIQAADNLRIRPEKHEMEAGESYNPRHHDQHYHVETRRNPNKNWRHENTEIIKPSGYKPKRGTGFLPGETFPGII